MSDTDDTEKLLLIPPDHFRVFTSDSDNSTERCEHLIGLKKSNKHFVDNITEKVDKLKFCLEKLENTSISEPSSRIDLINPQYSNSSLNTPVKDNTNNCLFIDTLCHTTSKTSGNPLYDFKTSSSCFHSNARYLSERRKSDLYKQSLQRTPFGYRGKAFLPVNLQSRFSVSSFESDSASDCSINSCTLIAPLKMESDTSSIFPTPQKRQDSFMLSEIDAFLDNICKNDGRDNLDESVYLKTPTFDKWYENKHESFQSNERNNVLQFKSPDDSTVDPLSKCFDWQESQLRSKSKEFFPEAAKDCESSHYSELGALKDSVPDLGFGMRDIMYPKDVSQSTEKPSTKQSLKNVPPESCVKPDTVASNKLRRSQEEFDLREKIATHRFQDIQSGAFFQNKTAAPVFTDHIKDGQNIFQFKSKRSNVDGTDHFKDDQNTKGRRDQFKNYQKTPDKLDDHFQNDASKINSQKVSQTTVDARDHFREVQKPSDERVQQNIVHRTDHFEDNQNTVDRIDHFKDAQNTLDKRDHYKSVEKTPNKREQFTNNQNSGDGNVKAYQNKEYNYGATSPKRNYPSEYENTRQGKASDDKTINHRKVRSDNTENAFGFIKPNYNPDQSLSTLPSLSNMWASSAEFKGRDMVDSRLFEEEKLRREHCEDMIQQLQKKLLEQQQKLAIACNVDKSKDGALLKMKSALVGITNKVSSLENTHSQQIEKINSNFNSVVRENEELKKKVEVHKSEMAKALQFAHDCQEKCRVAFGEKDNIISTLKTEIEKCKEGLKDKDERYAELKESNTMVVQLNRQISENLTNLQNNIEKLKQDHILENEELMNLKKVREALEEESAVIKNERNDLRLIISEEKSRNTHLDAQKKKLQATLDSSNKKMESLQSEFEKFKQQSEEKQNDQKTFYQKQVENIVIGKLNEFQKQLNAAESLMENEMQNKQREIAVQFAKQLHKAEQQHKLEVDIIEEKHKEEIKLYRIQLAQLSQTIQQLEEKLSSYKNRRGLIAAQLHSVMENQWQQALKIITNGASSENQHLQGDTESQVSVGFQQIPPSRNPRPPDANSMNPFCGTRSNSQAYSNPNQALNANYEHFQKPIKIQTNRESSSTNIQSGGVVPLTEDDIQRYVKLLLQKPPGVTDINPSAEKGVKSQQVEHQNSFKTEDDEYPTSDRNNDPNDRKLDRNSQIKPPWK